ncbi:MAG: type IV pilus secretin PilQ, partial [Xanthomonadaceae bacterium]|nr:type IV pilus secretin PilQ [Xanthomonadaceae bacterium]
IDTREVNTQVLVDNGETLVLGGIYEQTTLNEVDKVPLFGDLPGVGWMFRTKRDLDEKSELLIFVTPRIVKDKLNL